MKRFLNKIIKARKIINDCNYNNDKYCELQNIFKTDNKLASTIYKILSKEASYFGLYNKVNNDTTITIPKKHALTLSSNMFDKYITSRQNILTKQEKEFLISEYFKTNNVKFAVMHMLNLLTELGNDYFDLLFSFAIRQPDKFNACYIYTMMRQSNKYPIEGIDAIVKSGSVVYIRRIIEDIEATNKEKAEELKQVLKTLNNKPEKTKVCNGYVSVEAIIDSTETDTAGCVNKVF